MPRIVKGPDGTVHKFPDEATDAMISAALGAVPEVNTAAAPKAPTWAEQLGLHSPTTSRVGGFLRGSGGAVVDMMQGAVGSLANTVGDIGKGEMAGIDSLADPKTKPVVSSEPVVEIPSSPAGIIGSLLPIKLPTGGAAVNAAEAAIPRTARAAAKFKEVMGAAGHLPVDVSGPGNVALRITELAERGGSMPMAVRKFLSRVTDPNKAPMLYEEARDFASNISRLSADEFGRLTPVIAREVAEMRVALNKAIAETAKQAGKGEQYAAAMKEYARAMRVRNVVHAALEGAKKSAPYATAAGAGAWLGKKFADLIDQ